MKINSLEKRFGSLFPEVFKFITFDNGSEFARHKDIEKKPTSKEKRTTFILADRTDHVIVLAMEIVMDLSVTSFLKDMQLIPFLTQ